MFILLLIIHFVSDFLMQSREMGQKKSTEFKWLYKHLRITYYMFFFGLAIFYYFAFQNTYLSILKDGQETLIATAITKAALFSIFNVIVHGIIDWNIWKVYKWTVGLRFPDLRNSPSAQYYKYWEDSWFYSTIGFDQLLHISTLYILWELFK